MLTCHCGPQIGGRASFQVVCGKSKKKGNGKGKAPNSSPGSGNVEKPRRVETGSTYSLKQQLRFLQAAKRWETKQQATPVVRSKFRKQKPKEPSPSSDTAQQSENGTSHVADLVQEEAVLRQGKGLSSLYNTKAKSNPPAVLVDGYNVLMQWVRQPGDAVRKGLVANDFQGARDMILRDFSDYSGWRKLRMMVAFDAQGNIDAPSITRDQFGGVEVVFVGKYEADSFIIAEARQLRTSGCPYVLVASSDNDVKDACWSDEIVPLSALQLLADMKKARKEMDTFYTEQKLRRSPGRLGTKLQQTNPQMYEMLEKARVNGHNSS